MHPNFMLLTNRSYKNTISDYKKKMRKYYKLNPTQIPKSSIHPNGITLPPQMFCVFSTIANLVIGSCISTPRILVRNSSNEYVPSSLFGITFNETPATVDAPAENQL